VPLAPQFNSHSSNISLLSSSSAFSVLYHAHQEEDIDIRILRLHCQEMCPGAAPSKTSLLRSLIPAEVYWFFVCVFASMVTFLSSYDAIPSENGTPCRLHSSIGALAVFYMPLHIIGKEARAILVEHVPQHKVSLLFLLLVGLTSPGGALHHHFHLLQMPFECCV
jgi:hypothetical protein